RWTGGGLLAVVSVVLHGVLLGLPVPEADPSAELEPQAELSQLSDPAAVVDVVRLPAPQAVPEAAPAAPTVTPPLAAARPAAPAAPRPTAGAIAPAPAAPAPSAAAPAEPPPPAEPPIEPLPAEPPPPTLDERLRDPAAYQFNQQAKSVVNNEITLVTDVISTWLLAELEGVSDDQAPIMGRKLAPLAVPYPLTSCLSPAPAEGLLGVIVTPTGELAKAPVLLDSTGYTVLDEKALELALQQAFPPQAAGSPLPNPQAHWLPVQVQYEGSRCTP
ncbi:MAG TPA: hypothetical protein VLS96_20870, partial [Nodosilinea sp.]|nr:hypothetical protein [Nodosilinea sp.]